MAGDCSQVQLGRAVRAKGLGVGQAGAQHLACHRMWQIRNLSRLSTVSCTRRLPTMLEMLSYVCPAFATMEFKQTSK